MGLLFMDLCMDGPAQAVRAETGTVISRAGRGGPATGLILLVDSRWVNGNGMRPVRVQLQDTTAGGSPNPRQFTVQLTVRQQHRFHPFGPSRLTSVRVTDTVELPAGSTVVEKVISVPQHAVSQSLEVRVWQGARELEQLRADVPFGDRWLSRTVLEHIPTVMFVDRDVDPPTTSGRGKVQSTRKSSANRYFNVAALLQVLPYESYWSRADFWSGSTVFGNPPGAVLAAPKPESTEPGGFAGAAYPGDDQIGYLIHREDTLCMLHPLFLPERWIDLSAVDMIFTSWSEMEILAKFPSKLRALRDWVCAGHVLVVGGMGDDSSRFAELSGLLKLPVSPAPESTDVDWQTPPKPEVIRFPSDFFLAGRNVGIWPATPVNGAGQAEPSMTLSTSGIEPQFRIRNVGTGVVVGIATDDPCQDAVQLNLLFRSLPLTCLSWMNRYGVSLARLNSITDIMIPGFGEPPVRLFLVVVTLFALAIGPLNYWALWRKKLTHWILITVPIGAVAVTLGTIAYAFLAEGLGVRVKIRSITLVEPGGAMITLARDLYYAGMAPSAGLQFPDSALVVPFESDVEGDSFATKELRWGDGQAWRGGYFSSRQLRPLLVVNVGHYGAQVVVGRQPDLVATNQLGAHVKKLFVQGDGDQWFEAEDMAPGSQKKLVAVNRDAVRLALDAADAESSVGVRVPSPLPTRRRSWMPAADVWLETSNAVAKTSQRVMGLVRSPRAFVAIVERPSWLPVGVSSAREIQSLHVIAGSWSESSAIAR